MHKRVHQQAHKCEINDTATDSPRKTDSKKPKTNFDSSSSSDTHKMPETSSPDIATEGQDLAGIFSMLQGLQQGLNQMNQTMIDMRKDILDKIEIRVGAVEQRVDALELEVEEINKREKEREKREMERGEAEKVPFDYEHTVVVHKLEEGETPSEEEDKTKMTEIIKLLNTKSKVVATKRMRRQGDTRIPLLKVELENKTPKVELLKAKSQLKSTDKYKDIYIRSSQPYEQRVAQSNLRNLIKMVPGLDGKAYVAGDGRLIMKEDTSRGNGSNRRGGYENNRGGRGGRGRQGGHFERGGRGALHDSPNFNEGHTSHSSSGSPNSQRD